MYVGGWTYRYVGGGAIKKGKWFFIYRDQIWGEFW